MTYDVVDAHVHLWSVTDNAWYPALQSMAGQLELPELYSDFLPTNYLEAAGDFKVDAFVHVSATTATRTYLDEQAWVEELADRAALNLVTIGTIDPTLSESEIIADLERQAQSDRFRGVRVLYDFHPDSTAANAVLQWLNDRNHVFDLVTQPPNMAAWLRTLERYPDVTVVLEHCGWPSSTTGADRDHWAEAMRACAERTNALCKISGLGMVTGDLSSAALRPWVEGAIEVFGWDRVTFGSNTPIETMAGSYSQFIESLRAIVGESSDRELRSFYSDNARRYYKI
ncbi:amidohydrolase family protein [Rhodococcus sp. OK302]|uniref:amidohydrolase family protein n=1 Tax=Rhodococcus sp. OK302 TaxID=1882769 RepID=UPI00159569F2|nr:amidohydrolase family protein [Rhodococcus sp. OK302]